MVILTLERVVGFCEYSNVNMIIDQLKHSDGRWENKTLECLERVIENKSRSPVGGLNIEQNFLILSGRTDFFSVDDQISTKQCGRNRT